MSVLICAAEPVLILLLAAAVLREHAPLALTLTIAVAVLGVLLVVYQPGATGDATGVALTFAAVAACALYRVLTRRLLIDDASLPVVLTEQAAALGFALSLAMLVQAAGGQGWSIASMTPLTWLGAVASGILYYGARPSGSTSPVSTRSWPQSLELSCR